MEERTYRRRPRSNPSTMYLILVALFLFLTFSLIIKGCSGIAASTPQNNGPILSTNPLDNVMPTETRPADQTYVVATASLGFTGDIMGHGPVLNSVVDESGNYDFSECFRYVAPLFKSYDMMVANLEVTMGGTEAGESLLFPGGDRIGGRAVSRYRFYLCDVPRRTVFHQLRRTGFQGHRR